MAHLRRAAKEIREDVTDEELRDMIIFANGGLEDEWRRGVSYEEFEDFTVKHDVLKQGRRR